MLPGFFERLAQRHDHRGTDRNRRSLASSGRRTAKLTLESLEDRRLLTISYTVTDLGTLPGGDLSQAYAINQSGQVVGGSSVAGGTTHAFLYSGGTMQDLGVLPGGSSAAARAINDLGQVVGASIAANGQERAFLYSGGTMQDLGVFPGGTFGAATGINNAGQIVGQSQLASGQYEGFLYQNGALEDIGTLGGPYSSANAISNEGQIVGISDTPQHPHAFVMAVGGTMQDLNTLPGGTFSAATAINASGEIVGQTDYGKGTLVATLYSGGAWHNLGILPGGTTSYAAGINDSGQVVGESDVATGGRHAFIYQNDTLADLNSLIDPASGWVLSAANGINNAGQIVGTGYNAQGRSVAYLLTPIPAASAPAVASVTVAGSSWTDSFLDDLQSSGKGDGTGFAVPLDGSAPGANLPWVNLNQIKIAFNENVDVQAGSLSIAGLSGATYTFADFKYDPTTSTATWTLSSPIGADKLSLVLHSTGAAAVTASGVPLSITPAGTSSALAQTSEAAGDFSVALNVLPGDVSGMGVVNGLAVAQMASHWLQSGDGDVNGDGVINGLDNAAIATHWLETLPTESSSSAAASAVPLVAGAPASSDGTSSSAAVAVVVPSAAPVTAASQTYTAALQSGSQLWAATVDQALAQVAALDRSLPTPGTFRDKITAAVHHLETTLETRLSSLDSKLATLEDDVLTILADIKSRR